MLQPTTKREYNYDDIDDCIFKGSRVLRSTTKACRLAGFYFGRSNFDQEVCMVAKPGD